MKKKQTKKKQTNKKKPNKLKKNIKYLPRTYKKKAIKNIK